MSNYKQQQAMSVQIELLEKLLRDEEWKVDYHQKEKSKSEFLVALYKQQLADLQNE